MGESADERRGGFGLFLERKVLLSERGERGVSAEALAELEARCEARIDEAARYARSRKESHAPQADEQQVGVFAPSPHP